MPAFTSLLLGAALAVGAGSAVKASSDRRKAERTAEERARRAEELRKKMASRVTAPKVKEEAEVELQSGEAAEEEDIRRRSKKGRLKVARKSVGGLGTGTGTGLKVG